MLVHPSVTVQVRVTVKEHPVPDVSAPSLKVAVSPVEQLYVNVGVPKAAVICAAVGLQATTDAAVTVITGFTVSLVKVMVCV